MTEKDATIAAMGDEIVRLRAAVLMAAVWFEEYAKSHRAKGAADKADRNQSRADALRLAVKS